MNISLGHYVIVFLLLVAFYLLCELCVWPSVCLDFRRLCNGESEFRLFLFKWCFKRALMHNCFYLYIFVKFCTFCVFSINCLNLGFKIKWMQIKLETSSLGWRNLCLTHFPFNLAPESKYLVLKDGSHLGWVL